jgi:lipoprotein-anchoring transpeptidase ErfK/SrfK
VRRPKYKFHASRNKPATFLISFLALALVILAGWLWYELSERSHNKSHPKIVAVPSLSTNTAPQPTPPPQPPSAQRPVQNVFEAQLALLQYGISSGSIDGVTGSQTRAAIAAFQLQQKLPATGELDTNTRTRLLLSNAPLTNYTVTPADLARLQPVSPTWLGKSQQTALDYETILELVSEKSFASPNLVRRLNPSIDWTNVPPGTVLSVPNAAYPAPPAHAAFVVIHLSGKTLEAFDAATNLLAHFPCSIAQRVEKRPVGELHVAVVAPNPNYTFDPAIFPESPEAQQINHKIILPPGPNNPVGVAWIGLDRPGYGIHGTPSPEQVGRTESHGCFRLANWNAEYLLRLIAVGTPVYVEE